MSVTPKKEWLGELGYCNCLLVVMSRLHIPRIELISNQPPLDLEALTSGRSDTQAWIRAQEFDYQSLDPLAIIETLARTAGITRFLWRYRPGSIVAHDCVEDDGPVLERRFRLALRRSDGVLRLDITLAPNAALISPPPNPE